MKGKCRTCYSREYKRRDPKRFSDAQKLLNRKPKVRYTTAKRVARYRGLTFNLSFDEYAILLKKKCEYCRGPLQVSGVGLDRKDSSRGYEPDNVVPCCKPCNWIKGSQLSYEEMRAAIRAVKSVRRKAAKQETP